MAKAAQVGDKNATFLKLHLAIFALESSKGHLGWKVTDLVRKSGVSRSQIYKYLGSSKEEMLQSLVVIFINDFYGLNDTGESRTLPDYIARARKLMIENPEAILFYQKWRAKSSPLQKQLIEIELKFQQSLRDAFPKLDDDGILLLHSTIHGLVTSPFLSAETAARLCKNSIRSNSKS